MSEVNSCHFLKLAGRLLKLILPHHAFNRAGSWLVVFGVALRVVKSLYFTLDGKIDQLANGHARIYFYWLGARYFQRPCVTKAYITFAGSSMYVNTQPAGTGFTFKKWNVTMSFSIF